jgi:hypothetical protein
MNEMFHKSQASTETTLELMQHGIVAMADRVQALETRLPIAATDPNATATDTHVDGDPFAEDPGVDNDEHSELPDPPPRTFNFMCAFHIDDTTTNTSCFGDDTTSTSCSSKTVSIMNHIHRSHLRY